MRGDLPAEAPPEAGHTIALASKKSRSQVWCSILKIVRTHFTACGGDLPAEAGEANLTFPYWCPQ